MSCPLIEWAFFYLNFIDERDYIHQHSSRSCQGTLASQFLDAGAQLMARHLFTW
ncbi:hypothetical protein SHPE106448_15395 [Shewanella pealeana]